MANEKEITRKDKIDLLIANGKNPVGKSDKVIEEMYAEFQNTESLKTKKIEALLSADEVKSGIVAIKVKRNYSFMLGNKKYDLRNDGKFASIPKEVMYHILRKADDVIEIVREK